MLPFFVRLLTSLPLLSLMATTPVPPTRIVDSVTGNPIPYGSAGIKNKPIGTVADSLGRFSTERLQGAALTDTLVVSCVGYLSQKVAVADLAKLSEIRLEPQVQALTEVVVRGAGWKRHSIGRNGAWGLTYYNFHLATDQMPASKLGREVGTILHMKANSFVEDAHFYIGRNNFKNLKFRLNVRALNSEDHPSVALLTRDVIFSVPNQASGWQHIDLRAYDINVGVHARVAVTLEWLDGAPDNQAEWSALLVPAALSATHRMVFRDKSEDQWKVQPLNLSLYVTVLSPN
ncbi:carboxypeptidase-like regulatory domain-containing protein [Hymenobacter arizonensis]|uniref:CarboxypepD_reg-like domain-containing protein n=1 Tax=Hymenobacter arizonensis TaxID=1227077 RepID=A0A1I5TT57_HYMAR|nr:carboxypeptidase-like regulatory domain-containing protein [Hymenobacter arizonensis]SFP86168.1 CarboxypepD_reg-like domain-containing protein [Hymenobacter arizonensis]